ncbi:hypothetical protein B7463_g8781, partial [Scytalidium lignicola]
MTSLLHTIILFSLAIASASSFNHQQPLTPQLPTSASHEDWQTIPGDSPFRHCGDVHPESDLFDIERVTLHPYPLRRNEDYTLIITGTFHATIPPDAPIDILVAVPATHDPDMPAQNYTVVEEFCRMTGPITQPASADDVLYDTPKMYNNTIQTCTGERPVRAVLPRPARIEYNSDVFWAFPEGLWFAKLDAKMPEGDDRRIFCLEVEFELI